MTKRKTFFILGALVALVISCSLSDGASIGAAVLSRATHSPQSNPPTPTIPTSTPRPESCTVTAGLLNMRTCGGTACGVLAVLAEGDDLTILAAGDWLSVETDKGLTGYINGAYCKIGEIRK